MNIIYSLLLIFLIALVLMGFFYAYKSPIKLKVIAYISLILFFAKIIALVILILANNQAYLYLIKPLYSLDIIAIPAMILLSIIVICKKNKVDIKYYISFFILLVLSYLVVIIKFTSCTILTNGLIYSYRYNELYLYEILFLFFMLIFLIMENMINLTSKIVFIFYLACFISCIDNFLYILVPKFLPEYVVGEILFVLVFDLCLKEVKR
ncbi:MAG: hypothetical protein ACERKV_04390 [Clostridiaceae bacterium]